MIKDMTEGNPTRLILLFTLPLILGNLTQQLYLFIDTLIVGRFLGVEALAAVGCTGGLMFLMLGFVMGFTNGLSIQTGQCFGARDMEGVKRSVASGLVLAILLAVFMTAFCVGLCREMLIYLNTPVEILEGAYTFLYIVFLGTPIAVFLQFQQNLLRALGDSRGSTMIMMIGIVLNLILEPIAILVLGWGIAGAALAMVAAQAVGVFLFVLYVWRYAPALHMTWDSWRGMDRKRLWEHFILALPMAFQASVISIGIVFVQMALNGLGSLSVAAFSAAQKIDALAMMPMMSFGMAMAAYSAQNYGAQKMQRIEDGVKKCIYLSVTFSVLMGIFNVVFGATMLHWFVGDGHEDVISYGQSYLYVTSAFYWVLSLLFIYRSTLQGMGHKIVPTIAGIMELLMRAGAAFVLADRFGYIGVCFSSPLAWVGSCIPLTIAFYMTRNSLRKTWNYHPTK